MNDYENNQKLSRALSFTLGLFILIGVITPVSASDKLSPGLDVIANDFTMAVDGLAGTEIYLSEKAFSEALGVENVGKITITSLPDSQLGKLLLDDRYVEVGQTVPEKKLDKLKFVPFGKGELNTSFSFCRGSDIYGTVYTCNIYATKTVNTAPKFDGQSVSAAVEAFSGVTYLGTLHATDNDGDELTFEIVSGASNGKVKLTDKKHGYYEYTSSDGYVGRDSFTVCAVDKCGNRSANTTVSLDVGKVNESEVFADMNGHFANGAVISCVRRGVIEAAASGKYYMPDEYMSRAEFLSLAMKAGGYSGFNASNTGFADDADIPAEYKGYVAAAEAFGFISGIDTEAGTRFYPNNQITRLEAAVMLSRINGITGDGTLTVSVDSNSIPAWAVSAVSGLNSAGILRGNGNGSLDAYAPVTRGAAAQMVYACTMYKG